MFSTRLCAIALVLAASCTNTFGLQQVALDDDRDGVLDDADNCPQDFNPRQQDFDRDGLGDHCGSCASPSDRDDDGDGIDDACDSCVGSGEVDRDVGEDGIDDGCEPCPEATGQDLDEDGVDDACDSCLRGPPLDEDGDGIANACDDCPSRPDPMQQQALDTDRLGDACDPDTDPLGASGLTVAQSPRMFDPFAGATGSWAALAAQTSDGVAHLPALGYGRASSMLSEEFLIETTVRFPNPAVDATFEVLAQGSGECGPLGSCSAYMSCTLNGDGHLVLKSFTGQPVASTEVLDVSGPILLWVRSSAFAMSPVGGLKQHCVGVDVHGSVVSLVEAITSNKDGLRYSANFTAGPQPVDLHYVWLVSN